jgi:hypothetical protein
MTAAIRFTVVWLITAGKLRQIGKETKKCLWGVLSDIGNVDY